MTNPDDRGMDALVLLLNDPNVSFGKEIVVGKYVADLRELLHKYTTLEQEITALRAQLAASGNYVANCDTEPTRIVFANGRIVTAIGGYLCVEMQDSVHVQACRPHDRAVLATSEGKEMLARAIDKLNNETAI